MSKPHPSGTLLSLGKKLLDKLIKTKPVRDEILFAAKWWSSLMPAGDPLEKSSKIDASVSPSDLPKNLQTMDDLLRVISYTSHPVTKEQNDLFAKALIDLLKNRPIERKPIELTVSVLMPCVEIQSALDKAQIRTIPFPFNTTCWISDGGVQVQIGKDGEKKTIFEHNPSKNFAPKAAASPPLKTPVP